MGKKNLTRSRCFTRHQVYSGRTPRKHLPISRSRSKQAKKHVRQSQKACNGTTIPPSALPKVCSFSPWAHHVMGKSACHQRASSSTSGNVKRDKKNKQHGIITQTGVKQKATIGKIQKKSRTVNKKYVVQDLLTRIRQIPLPKRSVPQSMDPMELGKELKLRLAAITPELTTIVPSSRKKKCKIATTYPPRRIIPFHNISKEGDVVLIRHVKVRTKIVR